jgi:hypothetical protein
MLDRDENEIIQCVCHLLGPTCHLSDAKEKVGITAASVLILLQYGDGTSAGMVWCSAHAMMMVCRTNEWAAETASARKEGALAT